MWAQSLLQRHQLVLIIFVGMHYSLIDNGTLSDREMNPDLEKNEDKLNLEGTRFLNDDRSCVKKLSNQSVLAITCSLFAVFVIAEIIGALVCIILPILYLLSFY